MAETIRYELHEAEAEADAAAPATVHAGPAAAAVLAVGLASSVLGVLSVLAAASAAVTDALTLSDRVGELSGLTTVTAATFFGAWSVLGAAWRRSDPSLVRIAVLAAALTAVGLLGTFPPVVNAIAG